MERIDAIMDWLGLLVWTGFFVAALWFSPSRLKLRDDAEAQRFVQQRWSLLWISAGLVGMKLPEAVGLEGQVAGEWISGVGFAAAVVGAFFSFRSWLRNRAV